ncbi:uncharacterized protein LOC117469831 isoform X2 [Trematomus bernacchii]|uniref:uncharacterized protein LOC117469831 isoform X2 n=1 Tax=Trematomus bernacchii TaxID=40690 RepID=UPI00146B7E54|nr:uncharacterized protein LOC117469831 isoform X2 [Trematomus bernacchii]
MAMAKNHDADGQRQRRPKPIETNIGTPKWRRPKTRIATATFGDSQKAPKTKIMMSKNVKNDDGRNHDVDDQTQPQKREGQKSLKSKVWTPNGDGQKPKMGMAKDKEGNSQKQLKTKIMMVKKHLKTWKCPNRQSGCFKTRIHKPAGGSVILESPAVPVMEGESVTLICRNQTSTQSADFYKDGRLISSSSSGNITIHRVSKSDEGLYKCNISDGGQSPDSWLAVRAVRPDSPAPPSLVLVLLPVFGVCLALGSLMLLGLWRNHKGEDEADVDYTNVTVTQEGLPIRIRDADTASTYSTVRT